MTTQTQKTASAFIRLAQTANTLKSQIGNLNNLSTTDKTSLVNALNETKSLIPTLTNLIDDTAASNTSVWSSAKTQQQISAALTALITGGEGADTIIEQLTQSIEALAQADNGLLNFNAGQDLTPAQQLQGCNNLGIGDPTTDYVALVEDTLNEGL